MLDRELMTITKLKNEDELFLQDFENYQKIKGNKRAGTLH